MKKYLMIMAAVILLGSAFAAKAQTVRRTQKTPDFFVPNSVLQQAHKTENLPSGQQMLQNAAVRANQRQSGGIEPSYSPSLGNYNYSSVSGRTLLGGEKMKTKAAPVDKILEKQHLGKYELKEYKDSILASYYLLPRELEYILQREKDTINADIQRMTAIRNNWNNQSGAFRFVNYKLDAQISEDMTKVAQNYKKRQKKFAELLKKTPPDRRIAVIEATDPVFWLKTVYESTNKSAFRVKQSETSQDLHYVSVFDAEFKHVFTYHRKHIDPNRNRRVIAAKSGNPKIDAIYQNLFDGYLNDLGRIGAGLDVNNPVLLRQISEMQDKKVSESY